jgi:formate dehydrogenase alpha subunit
MVRTDVVARTRLMQGQERAARAALLFGASCAVSFFFREESVRLVDLIPVTIDGQRIEVSEGTSVLEAAELIGIDVPRLCHDPVLGAVGTCRLCVVEIDGMRNLRSSCTTKVTPDMVVRTRSPRVVESRRTVLELLLSDHPADCLTCEKMGNCKLAEYAYDYGVRQGGFAGEEHHYELDDTNPFILRDMNKCILCGKCVRACQEVTGKNVLGFAFKGFDTKATPWGDTSYIESDCIFCGNCVAVCPTGALTEKGMQGQGRTWEMEKVRTTCSFCGVGCTVDLNVKDGKVVGVTSTDGTVNDRAMCVKGRFGWDYINSERRLTKPLIKREGRFEEASWDEALDLVASRLTELRDRYGPRAFGALSSARTTNETNYLMQKFARGVMGTNSVDHCART